MCQIILVVGTFSGVALSIFGVSTWAAISAALVGAVTAWSEFHSTEDKITRYSDAVTQIDSCVLWWKMVLNLKYARMHLSLTYSLTFIVFNCAASFGRPVESIENYRAHRALRNDF